MSNTSVLESLKVGDIVKVTRTVEVIPGRSEITDGDGRHVFLQVQDVREKKPYILDDSPTLKIEMVKKVAKQRTDYKVGDVVSGDELRATMWVRSTIVRNSCNEDFILVGSGRWRWARHLHSNPLSHWSYGDFGFDEFNEGPFELRYLP